MKFRKEKQEGELRKELEKAAQSEEKSVENLRQQLEQARAEKENAISESYKQRDELQEKHRAKIAQAQNAIDNLQQELAEERAQRKDAESELDVLRVRAENNEKTLDNLSDELEAVQAEHRARERAVEKAHQEAVEDLRNKLRNTQTELATAQQQLRQGAIEQQKLRDEVATKADALDHAKADQNRLLGEFDDELHKRDNTYKAKLGDLEEALEQLRGQRNQLEADNHRLERNNKDLEARLLGTSRQVEEERGALEGTAKKLQEAKNQGEELRRQLAVEQDRGASLEEKVHDLERQLGEAGMMQEDLEQAVQLGEKRLSELQGDLERMSKAHETKLNDQGQRHKAEAAALRMSAEQLRGELNRAKDELLAKEAKLQELAGGDGRPPPRGCPP
ncbi:hypothetical protein AGDE_09716 [Angomonas deanei]|nr:hypothetical protein AGDE_09716 [Angomonas deanei]|eukprot:EPY29895.1 hypothetical protein AGDE_09716 [Angomonas deanei]